MNNKNRKKIYIFAAAYFITTAISAAGLKMPDVFGDNMVLQQGKPISIWGAADANAKIVITFAGQQKSVIADINGTWKLFLNPIKASSTPRILLISSGEEKVELKNVLVGEVWLCSGQSNMYYPLGIVGGSYSGVDNGEDEVANAKYPLIRLYCDPNHEYWKAKQWQECSPEVIRGFSSTAYFFGRELFRNLNVPVGIINISRGGSLAQSWTPEWAAEKVPFVKKQTNLAKAKKGEIEVFLKERASKPISDIPSDIELFSRYNGVGSLYHSFVKPIVPFTLAGVVWYQGEGNSRFKVEAYNYSELLEALIIGWRKDFNQNLFFIVAQLPVFATGEDQGPNFYIIREQQRRAVHIAGNAGLVVQYDFCSADNLHPTQKQETGRRISLWALAEIYKQNLIPSGPLFKEAHFDGHKVVCEFYYSDGLKSSDNQPLRTFALAGKDGVFYPAKASIAGNTVELISAHVKQPVQASFFYGDDKQIPNLINKTGLPASGFIYSK